MKKKIRKMDMKMKYAEGGMTTYGLVSNDVFVVIEPNHQATGDMFTYIGTDDKGRIKAKSYPSKGKNPITLSDLSASGIRKITKEEATKLAKRKVLGNIANRMSGINYMAKGGAVGSSSGFNYTIGGL